MIKEGYKHLCLSLQFGRVMAITIHNPYSQLNKEGKL